MKFGFSVLASGLLALAAAAPAQAVADKVLNVTVIQVCKTDGSDCASLGPSGNNYFAAETNAIWAQAGISVNFTFGQQVLNDDLLDMDDTEFTNYVPLGFSGTTMYLVNSLFGGAFGVGTEGYGGVAIAMDAVMSFNNGAGRLDTIAHELGHNLLPQNWAGSIDGHSPFSNHLMASGGIRSVPTGINQIAPNGPGYDLLTPQQIAMARGSGLLVTPVPEPGEWAMMVAGLGVVGFAARRKRLAA